jgi:hypothetical protein
MKTAPCAAEPCLAKPYPASRGLTSRGSTSEITTTPCDAMPRLAIRGHARPGPSEVQFLAAFDFRKLSHDEFSKLSIFLRSKIAEPHTSPCLFQNLFQNVARVSVWKIIFH